MRVIKYFGVAWQSIQAHRMRAILTMLGIIIGIAAVLVTVGIGSGAAASITERIESSGTNLLTISSGSRQHQLDADHGRRRRAGQQPKFSDDHRPGATV